MLETELSAKVELAHQIRVLESWGPSPIPPWIIHRSVPSSLRADLRAALVSMHQSSQGHSVINRFGLQRFSSVTDRDYDPIREMYALGKNVSLTQ